MGNSYFPHPNPYPGPLDKSIQERKPMQEKPEELIMEEEEKDTVLKVVRIAIGVSLFITLVAIGFFLEKPEDNVPPVDPDVIIAAEGGVVEADGASLDIPAGALREDTKIMITKVSEGEVTDLYHLAPDGLRFLKPVTLRIPYKGESKNIFLEMWNGRRQKIRFFVDEQEKKLEAKLLHL